MENVLVTNQNYHLTLKLSAIKLKIIITEL